LERTAGFGFGPQYQVRIAKSGEIVYRPGGRVQQPSGEVVFQLGDTVQTRQVRGTGFLDLVANAEFLGFWDLPEVIAKDRRFGTHCVTDAPTAIVTIFLPNRSKRVVDYQGCQWAPAGLRDLECLIDSVAGTTTSLCPDYVHRPPA